MGYRLRMLRRGGGGRERISRVRVFVEMPSGVGPARERVTSLCVNMPVTATYVDRCVSGRWLTSSAGVGNPYEMRLGRHKNYLDNARKMPRYSWEMMAGIFSRCCQPL